MDFIIKPLTEFYNRPDFFWFHGYGLTTLWILASVFAILFKKISVYLHALCFFIIDVSTMFLIGGAIYRYLPKFASWQSWETIRQVHIFGGISLFNIGILVLSLIILQHIGGVMTIFSEHKKNPVHKKFGFVVANLARVTVIVGWTLGGNMGNMKYCAIATVVLFVAGLYNVYFAKSSEKKAEEAKTKSN